MLTKQMICVLKYWENKNKNLSIIHSCAKRKFMLCLFETNDLTLIDHM